MTKDEARKAAEVMLAYADGKEIEQQWGEKWGINEEPKFDWGHIDYRIKPEPTYRPFKDAKECWQEMQKHQPFGWLKTKDNGGDCFVNLVAMECDTDFENMFDLRTFADGEPFGVKEE